jgi:TatD DNase family protein
LAGIVDSHCHLQHVAFDADRDAVIDRAREAGLVRIVVPGWDVRSSEAALELAARYPDLLVPAVGVHPHDAAGIDEAGWARLETLAADPAVRAIGEIGLDFFRNLSPPDAQRDALARQLALAASLGRPVLVHDREAHEAITEALLAWTAADPAGDVPRGVLHAFSGDAAMAAGLSAAGFLISFALPIAFSSAIGPRDAAAHLSPGSILVETDSPYLGPDRDRRNEPTTVLRVAAELARLRGTTPESVASSAAAGLRRLLDRQPRPAPGGTPLAGSAVIPSSPTGGS